MQDAGLIVGIIGGVFGAVGVIVSIILGVAAYRRAKAEAARTARKDICQESITDANLANDVKYIVRSVDDIKYEQRGLRQDFGAMQEDQSNMKERITRCEEVGKSAHKRLDELTGRKNTKEEEP